MNSLYTLGSRQTSSLQQDLQRMQGGDSSPALQGQITASLAALHRTVEDYDAVARREMVKVKQEKAQMRVQKFRSDYNELRAQFERLKSEQSAADRAELLGGASSASALSPNDSRRRFAPQQRAAAEDVSASPFRTASAEPRNQFSAGTSLDREAYALHEHSFTQAAHTQLDDFIAQGREVLDNLVDQRNVLKGTQRRLLDAANTMGLSRDVIGWIERRSTQDMYIFIAGAIFTFFCFFMIWKYLG